MKKSLITFFQLCIFSGLIIAQPTDEPIIRPGVFVGFNATQVDGDDLTGYRKIGANIGGTAFIRLPRNFSVSFEILYTQKGAKSTVNQPCPNSQSCKLILDYIDVPLMINYHDKQRAIFGLGVAYSNLIRHKEIEDGDDIDERNSYNRVNAEAVVSITFIFKENYGVNMRFTYSLSDINKEPIAYSNLKGGGQRNNVLSLRGLYLF